MRCGPSRRSVCPSGIGARRELGSSYGSRRGVGFPVVVDLLHASDGPSGDASSFVVHRASVVVMVTAVVIVSRSFIADDIAPAFGSLIIGAVVALVVLILR